METWNYSQKCGIYSPILLTDRATESGATKGYVQQARVFLRLGDMGIGGECMTEECYVLLLASGMCLAFSGLILLLAIKVWHEAKDFFDLAWDLAHHRYRFPEKPEITE